MGALNLKKAISDEMQSNPDFIVLYQYIDNTSGRKARPCHVNGKYISFALRGQIETSVIMADGTFIPIAYAEFDKIVKKLGSRGVKGTCIHENEYGTVFNLEAVVNLDCLACVNVDTETYQLLGQDGSYLFKFNTGQDEH